MSEFLSIDDPMPDNKVIKEKVENFRTNLMFEVFLVKMMSILNLAEIQFIKIKVNNNFYKSAKDIYLDGHYTSTLYDSQEKFYKDNNIPVSVSKQGSYSIFTNPVSKSTQSKILKILSNARGVLVGNFSAHDNSFEESVIKWQNKNITKENYQYFLGDTLKQPLRAAEFEKTQIKNENILNNKEKKKNIL